MITDTQRIEIVIQARRLSGVRFVHAGRTDNGVDCVGLLLVAAWRAGIHVLDSTSYSSIVDGARVKMEIERACIEREPPYVWRPGDVLLFNVGGSPQHTAMITEIMPGTDHVDDRVYMIHAHQSLGKVVEHRMDRSWSNRLVGIYTWRGN